MNQNQQPLNLPKFVPFLPGHSFTDPFIQNFHKTQLLQVHLDGARLEQKRFLFETQDQNLLDQVKQSEAINYTYGNREKVINDAIPRIQPQWIKYNRKVLRFAGYFQESVVENPIENYRIRKCLIYYYLNDDTIYICEPKIPNHGINQGVFLKRQKVPKEIGDCSQYVTWKDFNIGINLKIFERIFRITECDEFTKVALY